MKNVAYVAAGVLLAATLGSAQAPAPGGGRGGAQ